MNYKLYHLLNAVMAVCLFSPLLPAQTKTLPDTVSVTADNQSPDYSAPLAVDGDTATIWHTEFVGTISPMPHWIELDLKGAFSIQGIAYTPRKDGENGTFNEIEVYVYDNPQSIGQPIWKGEIKQFNPQPGKAIEIRFASAHTGRYIRLQVLSSINKLKYASAAEIQPIIDGKVLSLCTLLKPYQNEKADSELVSQFNWIGQEINNRGKYKKILDQVYDEQSTILPSDNNPVDVIFRRTQSAINRLQSLSQDDSLLKLSKQLEQLNPAKTECTSQDQQFDAFTKIAAIRREVMFSDPAINFNKILFVKKHRATFNHLCDQYYGVNLVPGGGIFELDNIFSVGSKPVLKNVLENSVVQSGRLKGQKLDSGAFATLALNYPADKIAFAYVECTGDKKHQFHTDLTKGHWDQGRCLHIFTCNSDGSDLQQITDGTWNDFYPCFLPNQRLAFISERRGGYLRCGRECPNYTVFDMNQDGSKMRCLSYHETNEWAPTVSNDGKIIWTRWDYIDRHGCTVHHPWVMSLNGSDPRQIHGNYTIRGKRADTEMDIHAIPHSSKLLATAGPHHGQNYGSLVIIDPSKANGEEIDNMTCVKRITPDIGFPESQGGAQVWGFSYPVSEDVYLAVADFSMQPNSGMQGQKASKGNYGIYLLDRFGNRELIYRDEQIGCASPIPFIERKRPVVVPELVEPGTIPSQEYIKLPPRNPADRPQATVTLANVYQSLRPLPSDKKITSLRIVQLYSMSVPSGWGLHTGYQETSSRDSVNLVRGVLGTVPVEADGSAHFTVPAQSELFFQALDEKGDTVQSMRSGTYFQPGDNVGCVGCHEPKSQITRSDSSLPTAFKRPASVPVPDVQGSRPANFVDLVQPVLDKHCVECHNKPESKTFSLAKEPFAGRYFQSYDNLMKRGFGFHSYGNSVITVPGKFGSGDSKLLTLLDKGHYDVKLTEQERHRIALWLDMLSPFYGVYEPDLQKQQLNGQQVYPTLE